MTTLESIQMNIFYCKTQLNKARRAIFIDQIEKLNNEGMIEFYTNELKDLKFSVLLSKNQNN
jgi:cob(I)alamin adenosyltransferase